LGSAAKQDELGFIRIKMKKEDIQGFSTTVASNTLVTSEAATMAGSWAKAWVSSTY